MKGTIRRETIRGWLDNYQALISDGGRVPDAIPRNGGQKPYDGITNSLLNRVILADALGSMKKEARILYYCCRARWIDRWTLKETLRKLHLTQDKHYRRCDWAVDYIYYHVNGMTQNRRKLVAKLSKIDEITTK